MVHPPRITVITPCFNQARFLERAICSVLDQGYDNLEYAIIDGGSCDGSIDIIRRYENDLAWWFSTDDAGPADALNRALTYATGDIIAYLQSDDLFTPFALPRAAERMTAPDAPQWLVGGCATIDADDRVLDQPPCHAPADLAEYLRIGGDAPPRFADFFTTGLLRRLGGFEAMLHHRFDLELHCRLLTHRVRPAVLNETLTLHRLHPDSMSGSDPLTSRREQMDVIHRYSRPAAQPAPPAHAAALL